MLDGLDLDFLTFGKGGVFQNLDDADFSFDDIGGFRLRGMSEVGLPDGAATSGMPQTHEPKNLRAQPNQKNGPSGNSTRDYRSGSIGWFDTNTFLNEKDPFLMKNYSNTDFAMNSLGNNANLEDRITARHNSFDGIIPPSPVNLYTSDGQVLTPSPPNLIHARRKRTLQHQVLEVAMDQIITAAHQIKVIISCPVAIYLPWVLDTLLELYRLVIWVGPSTLVLLRYLH